MNSTLFEIFDDSGICEIFAMLCKDFQPEKNFSQIIGVDFPSSITDEKILGLLEKMNVTFIQRKSKNPEKDKFSKALRHLIQNLCKLQIPQISKMKGSTRLRHLIKIKSYLISILDTKKHISDTERAQGIKSINLFFDEFQNKFFR